MIKTELFKDKKILITGGTGSIGSEIVRQLLQYEPRQIRVFSRDEYKQFVLQQQLSHLPLGKVAFLIGDVRDKDRLMLALEGVDIVFHAAALKHVPFCEYNPFEAVKTNVLGTQNVVDVARYYNIEKLIGISTDKAASPISTMGATKLLAEKIIISAEEYKGNKRTCFSAVRFGNVIGSRGSVLPLFIRQILDNREITLTDPEMTRFIMSIPQAIGLVFQAVQHSQGGEVFILKMPVARLGDLAECVIDIVSEMYHLEKDNIKIKVIGKRRGEKNYETLISEEETDNIYENHDMFCFVSEKHVFENDYFKKSSIKSFRSSDHELMAKDDLRSMVEEYLKNL